VVKQRVARKKFAAVAKWKASGLSQAEFCRREGLQEWQLSDWKRFVERLENEARDLPEHSRIDEHPGAHKEPTMRQKRRQQQDEIVAEPQPFVPVRVIDVAAEEDMHKAIGVVDFVLELVLKRGQILRVAPNCEPQFLGAVVSVLDL
jgi:hypothetical protein